MSFGPLTVNDGNGGGNYVLNVVDPIASGMITPAPLIVTANNATGVQGGPQPVFTASFGGFPAGLGASALSGTLTFTTTPIPGMPGTFEILPGGLSSSNFAITFVPGTFSLISGSSQPGSGVLNAGSTSSGQAPQDVTGSAEAPATGSGKQPDFSLPPVAFSRNYTEFALADAFIFLDPVVASLVPSKTSGTGADTGNWTVPSLDERGNPIGPLIGFNSTFIETCRARAALCR
ncbi:MAG: hypothetical protein JOZ88_06015 [Hyphomicrobiales bacterium]|nr:hypothetical protein [Hyphomicrobiales bacterium]